MQTTYGVKTCASALQARFSGVKDFPIVNTFVFVLACNDLNDYVVFIEECVIGHVYLLPNNRSGARSKPVHAKPGSGWLVIGKTGADSSRGGVNVWISNHHNPRTTRSAISAGG
jgi:hypothetical protein